MYLGQDTKRDGLFEAGAKNDEERIGLNEMKTEFFLKTHTVENKSARAYGECEESEVSSGSEST